MKTREILAITTVLAVLGCSVRTANTTPAGAPNAQIDVSSSPNTIVDIFSSVPSRFALRGAPMRLRGDTIRVTTPVRLEAYLDAGDIHIRAINGADVSVTATTTNAPATNMGAVGPHIVLQAGGTGIGGPR